MHTCSMFMSAVILRELHLMVSYNRAALLDLPSFVCSISEALLSDFKLTFVPIDYAYSFLMETLIQSEWLITDQSRVTVTPFFAVLGNSFCVWQFLHNSFRLATAYTRVKNPSISSQYIFQKL